MKYTFEPNNSTDEFAIELRRKVEKCLADCNQSSKKLKRREREKKKIKTKTKTSEMVGNILLRWIWMGQVQMLKNFYWI